MFCLFACLLVCLFPRLWTRLLVAVYVVSLSFCVLVWLFAVFFCLRKQITKAVEVVTPIRTHCWLSPGRCIMSAGVLSFLEDIFTFIWLMCLCVYDVQDVQ